MNERERRERAWAELENTPNGECTCEWRAVALGYVRLPEDRVPIDPACDVHGHLLEDQ